LPIKDLIRRGWLEPSENIEVLETRVLSFLGVKTLDDAVEPLACAARKSTSYTETTPAQTAWLLRVRRIAETMVVAKRFTEQLFERALTFLRNLMVHEQEARHVPRVLSEAGIRFLIVEHLPHTKIDGVCLWLDASSPVVALSCRFDRIDSFWFTLAHELGHVKHQHGLNAPVKLDADLDGTLLDDECPSEERLANEFASNLLVPSDALQDFMARVRPLYSRQKINGFAAVQRVHPGIVVGQLHGHHEIGYAHSREALTKVRDVVVESALTDGWGNFIPSEA
jgi:HTH-type transcriptional regulator/antitoxin HigA